jgi:ABC-type Fe3+/spermidine/putrescine transport system ATPase subunit
MAFLEWRGLVKRYAGKPAVDGVTLSLDHGGVLAVLGPSGSGKTTLLRLTAGLEPPDAGTVLLDGADLGPLPPERRGIGLVFQEYALFPHLDVAGNVGFGLRMAGWPRRRAADRVRGMLDLVGLSGYERRRVQSLSGGEQQRVALARGLAPGPRVLMLDEPSTPR